MATLSLLQMLLVLVLFAVFFFSSGLSVFEDQVGVWDWHQQYIGKVKYATFQTQGAGRKRVVVATEQNVLASLNLRNGEIFWKHTLGDYDKFDGLEIVLGKYVLTLSQQGSTLRAWHLPDGQLVWETYLPSPGTNPMLSITSVDLTAGKGKGKLVLVLGNKLLHAISSIDGDLLWTVEFSKLSDNGEMNIKEVVESGDKKSLYGFGFMGSSGFSIWDIDAKTGHLNSRNTPRFQGKLSVESLVVTEFSALCLDSEGENIAIVSIIDHNQPAIHVTSIKRLIPGGLGKPRLLKENLEGFFALQFSNQITVVNLGSSQKDLEVVQTFEIPAAISKGVQLPANNGAFSVVQQVTKQKIAVHTILYDGGERKDFSELVELGTQKGLIERVYLNEYIRNDRSHGFRVLIVSEDSSLSLLQQGEVVWNREDGLASIIEASTAELPLETHGVSVAQVEHSLVEWLKGHWLKLKATLMVASMEEVAILQDLRLNNADKTKMFRDHNGFRKLLIVLTEAGKLYALHTGDGRIVWSLLISGFRSFLTSGENSTMLKLSPWQVPHKHALDENPVFLVAAKRSSGNNQVGILAWVDALSGKELKSAELTYFIEQIIPLPFTDSSEQRLHLIIDEHANAHLFPYTDESRKIFLDHVPNTYFYTVDEEKGIITGFVVKGAEPVSAVSPTDGYLFRSMKLWTIIFPIDSEKIITMATQRSDEVVHTQAKVLTNQDVLYKYLNKNTLFVATVAPRGSEFIGETSPEENWLVVYVIDTVTGQILYRLKHPNMHGPVHAVFSENWIVYHYFNVLAHRFEFSVLEMYDRNRVDNKKVLQVMLGRHNATAPMSSYPRVDLDVKMQSYFFVHSIKALTVTTTARGITGKQILIGSVGDQVLALDKRFFDPRRSPNPTSAEREDGIIPLTDAIPVQTQSYLTHSYQVEGLRGIISVPADLESTSLVFAYGVDLFYSHTAPSRIYDSLTEDFNYALLLITIVALLIAIVTTWILSEKKDLREKWK